MSKVLTINGKIATVKELKKYLNEKHDRWDLVRFEIIDKKSGKTWPRDAMPEEAKVIILEQMLLDNGCNSKLLKEFKEAVRDEARKDFELDREE
jgi:hypothetical protein